jgi:formylglycine-generating enzyme required for sulfatase activity
VSWEEARAYCRWAGLTLPSEAQWEAAARGKDRRRYPWGNEAPTVERANFSSWLKPAAVGSFPRGVGPYGTFDQAGNVAEWCEDAWDREAYRERERKDPIGTRGEATERCLRGGAYNEPGGPLLAAAYRFYRKASDREHGIGFRCVLPAPPKPWYLAFW